MQAVIITVPGEPTGKARPRFSKHHAHTPQKTIDSERRIKAAWQEDTHGLKFQKGTPLRVIIRAYYSIAKSDTKTIKQLKVTHQMLPTKKPDADNVCKLVLDALNGIAWHDDSQVVFLHCEKYFAESPSIVITVSEVF